MANQAIALGIRAPQPIDLGAATARFGNMMNQMAQMEAFKQEAAAKQFDREQKRALSAAYASSVNPQTGEIDNNMLIRNLQASGLGNAIPGALDDLAKSAKSRADAKAADLTYVKNFNDTAIQELTGALSPDQAVAAAERLKVRFSDLGGKIDELMQSMPKDPALYEPWRQEQLFHSMEADKQLSTDLTTQNLGTSTRILATPKYRPGAAATVVPGSEAAIAPDLKPVPVEGLGIVGYNPATNTYTPAMSGGATVGAGIPGPRVGGGSAATALQTNPGALKDGAFTRSQPGYKGGSGGFAVFETPQQGVAAQEKLLQSRYLGRGLNTVDKIVNTYAPQGPENSADSVSNYKSYIAQRAGIKVNQPLSAKDIPAVAAAMREFETGQRPGGGGAAAPATQGMTTVEAAQVEPRRNVSGSLQKLREQYKELQTRGGAIEAGGNIASNAANYIASSSLGTPFAQAAGTKAQATRDKIRATRRLLLQQIIKASGMSAQQANSNVELQGLLDSATDPSQSMETVFDTLDEIERLYGAKKSGGAATSNAPAAGKRKPLSSFGGRKK